MPPFEDFPTQDASEIRPIAGPGVIYMGDRAGYTGPEPMLGTGPNAARFAMIRPPENDLAVAMRQANLAARPTLPVDEQHRAVAAAMQYQGQRGYMRDVAAGKPSAEALEKWAPMMFSDPKTMSSGASMIRAMRPPEVKEPPANRFALQEHASVLDRMAKEEENLADDPQNKRAQAALQRLEQRKIELEGGAAPATAKKLDRAKAREFFTQAKGNADEARKLARAAGYEF